MGTHPDGWNRNSFELCQLWGSLAKRSSDWWICDWWVVFVFFCRFVELLLYTRTFVVVLICWFCLRRNCYCRYLWIMSHLEVFVIIYNYLCIKIFKMNQGCVKIWWSSIPTFPCRSMHWQFCSKSRRGMFQKELRVAAIPLGLGTLLLYLEAHSNRNKQSTNQPTNQSINQAINQSINQSGHFFLCFAFFESLYRWFRLFPLVTRGSPRKEELEIQKEFRSSRWRAGRFGGKPLVFVFSLPC